MAEELKKIQLTEEEGELIAGGTLLIENNEYDGRLLWSSENPSVQYTFGEQHTRKSITRYLLNNNLFNESDDVQINALLTAGIIWQK